MNNTGQFTKPRVVNAISANAPMVNAESSRSITITNVVAGLQVVATAFAGFYAGRVIGMFSGIYVMILQHLNEPWST